MQPSDKMGVFSMGIISVFSVPFHKQVIASTVFAQVRRDFSLLKILECETLQSLQA